MEGIVLGSFWNWWNRTNGFLFEPFEKRNAWVHATIIIEAHDDRFFFLFDQKQTNQQKTAQKQFATTVNRLQIRPKQLSKRIQAIVLPAETCILFENYFNRLDHHSECEVNECRNELQSTHILISISVCCVIWEQESKNQQKLGYSSHFYLLVFENDWVSKRWQTTRTSGLLAGLLH